MEEGGDNVNSYYTKVTPGPGLECPNCKCTIQIPQLGSQWRDKEDRNKGCWINGLDINHNSITVIPMSTDGKRVKQDFGGETRMSFSELFEQYELVEYFPDFPG